MDIENIKPENPDPVNNTNDGPDPEISKDLSRSPKEEKIENEDIHSEIADLSNTEDNSEKTDPEKPSREINHGIENGDEDQQNPYPDEYDPTIKK